MDNYNRDIKINKEAFTHENAAVCNNFVDSLKKGIQTSTRESKTYKRIKRWSCVGNSKTKEDNGRYVWCPNNRN